MMYDVFIDMDPHPKYNVFNMDVRFFEGETCIQIHRFNNLPISDLRINPPIRPSIIVQAENTARVFADCGALSFKNYHIGQIPCLKALKNLAVWCGAVIAAYSTLRPKFNNTPQDFA